ncbi:MAG: type II secretion system F family protein [Chthonomonadales bacterium]
MSSFTYTARDRNGAQKLGVVDARHVNEAREMLRAKDLFVVEIQEKASTEGSRPKRKKKVKIGDMVVMSRQLATLVRAGLSIIECLHIVATQTENSTFADALNDVRLSVLTGSTLADALRRHPKVFNEKYVALVQAGETGGVLDQTLEIAAQQFDQEADLREKVKAAFVYPMVVMFASIAVVIFMLVFIVPVFANVYVQFGAELPPVTQLLVTMSFVIVHYWWAVGISIYVGIKFLKKYHASPKGRRVFDQLSLKLPLLGKLNRKIAVSRFTQTFAGSVQAGVPILRALAISAQTSGNVIIMEAINKVTVQVKEGATLTAPLEATGQFPPLVVRMIAAGEQSGNLDEMLSEITKFYNRDIEYTVGKLTRIMEPAMTVVVGGIVLFVLLALYMPVFNLTNVVHK